jgi:nucleoside-diphosphate-sugar epimerase
MKAFVTGATGYIGFAASRALRRAGLEVSGLTRSEDKAKRLWANEIVPVRGDLRSLDVLGAAAEAADVIVHCAAEVGPEFAKLDRQAVERLAQASKAGGRSRTLIYTSGVWQYGDTKGGKASEETPLNPIPMVAWRPHIEQLALSANGVVIRPGCVYGGAGSLTSAWFESAEKEGAARIVGDGHNRWAMVHVEDLGDVYARVVAHRVRGEVFNAVDRSRYTLLENAQAASRAAGKRGEVRTVPVAEAVKQMGGYAEALALDQHIESWKAVNVLGWNPHHGGFADAPEIYYQAWKIRDA